MSKLYSIYEEDLETLERELPEAMWRTLSACNDPLMRERWDMVKEVLSNIRWNYGPPMNVKEVPAGEEPAP